MNYSLAIWAVQTSVVLLYVRVFRLTDRTFRLWIYFAVFGSSALCLATVTTLLLACRPVQYFWTRLDGVSQGTCPIHISTFYLVVGGINVAFESCLVVLPIPRVFRLQMSLWRKLIVCASLLLGIL